MATTYANALTTEKVAPVKKDAVVLGPKKMDPLTENFLFPKKVPQETAGSPTPTTVATPPPAVCLLEIQAQQLENANKVTADKVVANKVTADKVVADKVAADKVAADKVTADKVAAERTFKMAQKTFAAKAASSGTATATNGGFGALEIESSSDDEEDSEEDSEENSEEDSEENSDFEEDSDFEEESDEESDKDSDEEKRLAAKAAFAAIKKDFSGLLKAGKFKEASKLLGPIAMMPCLPDKVANAVKDLEMKMPIQAKLNNLMKNTARALKENTRRVQNTRGQAQKDYLHKKKSCENQMESLTEQHATLIKGWVCCKSSSCLVKHEWKVTTLAHTRTDYLCKDCMKKTYKSSLYKTTLCTWFEQGKCTKGDKCTHAHGPKELRKQ